MKNFSSLARVHTIFCEGPRNKVISTPPTDRDFKNPVRNVLFKNGTHHFRVP
jgi:hypothetical protein